MSLPDLLLIALSLSMDAFAVAVCKGLSMKKINYRHGVVIALFFGGFQALMPLIGWLLGSRFSDSMSAFGDWIAFGLLALIGGKMALEALKPDEKRSAPAESTERLDLKELTVMAVATSIDALAVGVTFALFPGIRILPSVGLIGVTTFLLSLFGVAIGNKFGSRYQKKAEFFGGVVLIGIGLKILLEHLGVLPL